MCCLFDDNTYQMVIRLILTALLSGVIGYEREMHGRGAGLRTTILVGVGSCLIMLTSMHIHDIYQGVSNVDPGRIAAQVVSGIGFLGAGTISSVGASVRGLTTAASLWAVSGVGLAIGSGYYSAALVSTAIIYVVLVTLSRLERRMTRDFDKTLQVECSGGLDLLTKITNIFFRYQAVIKNIDITHSKNEQKIHLVIQLRLATEKDDARIIESILKTQGVSAVQWG